MSMSLGKAVSDTVMNKKFIAGLISFVFITLALGMIFNYQASTIKAENYAEVKEKLDMLGPLGEPLELVMNTDDILRESGTVNENSQDVISVAMDKEKYSRIVNVTLALKWKDEADQGPRYTNQGDNLGLEVVPPGGGDLMKTGGPTSNPHGQEGMVKVSYEVEQGSEGDYLGEWEVKVIAEECGDQVPVFNIAGLRTISDTSNSYTLTMTVDYETEKE